jgi:DNA-binding NtrC family response regulator
VGTDPVMQAVYHRIRLAAQSEVTVLISGETGTGKELVAEALHTLSARRDKPLVRVNCSALSENLLESELFGHVKGAFTGAVKDTPGRIEMAEGGTLFLDEIGDISPLIQLKLLRVLQEHEYERVGDSVTRKANVRFIAATHRNLRERVGQGTFREDFYYRIRVYAIELPALREHKADIPLLCDAFIVRLNRRTGKTIRQLSDEAQHGLMDYCWPGNVRQLENAIEHAFVTCAGDTILMEDLPDEIRSALQREVECRRRGGDQSFGGRAPRRRAAITREMLLDALARCQGNQSEAARALGLDRTTIWRMLKRWSVQE